MSKPSVNSAVDRGEEGARLGALALVAPEAGEARRGSQLERAGALLAGDGEGAMIADGGLVGRAAGREEQVAVEAMEVDALGLFGVRRRRDLSRPCFGHRRAGRRLRYRAQSGAPPSFPAPSGSRSGPRLSCEAASLRDDAWSIATSGTGSAHLSAGMAPALDASRKATLMHIRRKTHGSGAALLTLVALVVLPL